MVNFWNERGDSTLNTNADFFNEFSRTNRPFTNQSNQILEKHGLSSSYWRVIRIIAIAGSKNFGDITDELHIEKPALTKIIKKLCDMGIVEIQRGHDKREKIVLLTVLGRKKMDVMRLELNPFLNHALQGISQEQLDTAKEVLQIIQNNIMNY